MHILRVLLLGGLGLSALLGGGGAAYAQVVEAPVSGGGSLVDENLNGIDDSEETPAAVFSSPLLDLEEQQDDLPDAPQAVPTRAQARAPVSGNIRAIRAQRVGIDPATGALTPLANRPSQPQQSGTGFVEDDAFAATGIRLGTFSVFGSVENSIGYTSNGDFTKGGQDGWFNQTDGEVNFISDWSRHQLRGGISAGYTEYFKKRFEDLPRGDANVELRLDGANDLIVTLGGNAALSTESAVSQDISIPGNTVIDGRPIVQRYSGFAEVAKGGTRLAPSLRASFDRVSYGDADISGGGSASQSARDNTLFLAALRLGYDSPGLFDPFVELEAGARVYDENSASARDSVRYGLRGGVAFGSGEKLNGELALGYTREEFEKSSLKVLDGLTVDAVINWSPHRFTNVSATATTQFLPSTSSGVSGSVVYGAGVAVSRAIRPNLSLNAQVDASLRDYRGSSRRDDSYSASIGAEWQMNRNAALFVTGGYEKVDSTDPSVSYDAATARGGIRLRR